MPSNAVLVSEGAAGDSLFILEGFWDRQHYPAAAYCLQQTSLYFACIANGNSQMYDSAVFVGLVERAGFRICAASDNVGEFHTLLECRPDS